MTPQLTGAEPWRPTPLLQTSLFLHIAALVLALLHSPLWPWLLVLIIGNHLIIAGAGLLPRSTLLGANMTRLPVAAAQRGEVCITIDDGPDPEVTPKVLAILAEHGAQASFFCIGEKVAQYPELARAIVAAGHRIENHSERHFARLFALLSPTTMSKEVSTAQDSIAAITGQRPLYFRAPAGIRNPFLDGILHQQGLILTSWTRRAYDTRESNADIVLQRLSRNLAGGDILLLHDGNAARDQQQQATIVKVLPRLLTLLKQQQLMPVALNETHLREFSRERQTQ